MPVSKRVSFLMTRSSWIRRMFEEGEKLRADGKGAVYDFSIGNPMLEPPGIFSQTLKDLAASPPPGLHRYMPNVGYASTRKAVAEYVTGEYKVPVTADHVIMTVGAAGGCNVALKALLEPGDEVILLLPFFCEYEFYIDNHGGVMVLVPTRKNFDLDLDAIERAITPKTRVIIVNTPNNPSGVVYSYESLNRLADLLRRKSAERGSPIYLLSDEAYRKIIYEPGSLPERPRGLRQQHHGHLALEGPGAAGRARGLARDQPEADRRGGDLQRHGVSQPDARLHQLPVHHAEGDRAVPARVDRRQLVPAQARPAGQEPEVVRVRRREPGRVVLHVPERAGGRRPGRSAGR